MSRPSTGVDISTLPRKAVLPEMAERTYQKYKKKLEYAYLEIDHAQKTGDVEHERLWQEALSALVARLEEVGRPVPTLEEIQTGRSNTTRLNMRSAAAIAKSGAQLGSTLDKAINMFKEGNVEDAKPLLKEELDKANKERNEAAKSIQPE